MERKYKITIPEPCQEDWNKMTPNDNGRFCESCTKNVVDFTNTLPVDIQYYFQQHSNICGRFKNYQLDSLTIQIPNRVLYSQTNYHKIFLLALFIAMGTTLFSCADKNGSKQKIDKIEIVNKPKLETHRIMIGEAKYDAYDTLNIPPPPPTKIDQVKFVKPQPQTKKNSFKKTPQNKDIIINETASNNNDEDGTIICHFRGISGYPEYIGGIASFKKYIKENYRFSEKSKNTKGILTASFLIEKDGVLDSISVTKDLGFDTKEELIRVLSNTKKWFPGEENGKRRNCKFEISITIKSDTTKKSFFRTKIIPKIDTLEIKRITKYEND
ncbi:hypothetical protein MCETHM1_02512 [Flavobacteriaceae bacterium]